MELLLLSLHLLSFVEGVKVTNMIVPTVVDTRDTMQLDCHFDMESDELFAVKWYKDDHEFFKYTPSQQPHIQKFPVAGVHVVQNRWNCGLNRCRIELMSLSRPHSSGAYKCEISTEAPTFSLASRTVNVTVATLPKASPRVEGIQDYYMDGDLVMANCTSAPSDPAPILTWYINNQQASLFTRNSLVSEPDADGLIWSSASLIFQAERRHSQEDDVIELRCAVALPGVPLPPKETVRKIIVKAQQPQSVKNQKLHWFDSSARRCANDAYYYIVVFVSVVPLITGAH